MNLSSELKAFIINTLKPYHPTSIGIFGSYARGEEKPDSDLDILVDFERSPNLFILMDIEEMLVSGLGMKIDLITKGSVNRHVEPCILKDLKRIA